MVKLFNMYKRFIANQARGRPYTATSASESAPVRQREQTQPRIRRNRRRSVFFHLAAMVVVLLPLVLLELSLRLFVPARAVSSYDPYVSFGSMGRLFVLASTGRRFETAKERLSSFCAQSFAADKGPKIFRIFCLGGSTVQGRPYSVETSFTSWLALNLRAARPEVDYEVVNCGGISYASYRLVPIMRELVGYKPDLFIIYTGHNEFLEDRTYHKLKEAPPALIRLHKALLNLRCYSLADEIFFNRTDTQQSPKTVLPDEVQTKLDFSGGLESYHRDHVWRRGTIEHFRQNLETMVGMSHSAGVPVILVNPVSNLKDCPPFKWQSGTGLLEEDIERIVELWDQASKVDWSDTYRKIDLLEQAAALDSERADLFYLIGKCYEYIGRSEEAKRCFLLAKENDICPLRILEPMHKAIFEISEEHNVPLVDVRLLFEQRSEHGITGNEWLLDHVHPKIEGHQLIADSLYQSMEEIRLVRTPPGWRSSRDELWQSHLASLDQAYYSRGLDRLERLRQWSHGRIPNPSALGADASGQ